MRILLVDDDECVTEAMERLLCQICNDWDIVTASSGPEALERMEEEGPFSLLVTDMRMPRMGGDELMEIVSRRWPETMRVVLSGQASMDSAAIAARYAHQFLAKPCTSSHLLEVISRCERFRRVIGDERLRRALGGITMLPPAPAAYAKLSVLLADPNGSVAEIASLLRSDPSLSAKVLQMVNSAFFASASRITDISRAVTRLGLRAVQSIVLSAEVQRMVSYTNPAFGELWAEGERAGEFAAQFAGKSAFRTDAWTAALLSPVGLLAVASARPEAALAFISSREEPPDKVDERLLGTSRHIVSAALLSIWGLPDTIVEPLRCADDPSSAPPSLRCIAEVVHIAIGRVTGRHIDPDVLAKLMQNKVL